MLLSSTFEARGRTKFEPCMNSQELNCVTTTCRHALLPSLSMIVLAARAHNLYALDGVHLNLSDMEEFAVQCRQGRELGFDGKTLIHPKVISVFFGMHWSNGRLTRRICLR